MKSKKIKLKDLKVKSFVTDLNNGNSNTVKGGTNVIDPSIQTDNPTETLDVLKCLKMSNNPFQCRSKPPICINNA